MAVQTSEIAGEVIIAGAPNTSYLVSGFLRDFRPDLAPKTFNDPGEAVEYLEQNPDSIVGVVSSLAKQGLFEKAKYSLNALLERVLEDETFALMSVAVVSMARKPVLEALQERHPRINFAASWTAIETDDFAVWARSLPRS